MKREYSGAQSLCRVSLLLLLTSASVVFASEGEEHESRRGYEDALVQRALTSLGAVPELSPEGKRIGTIRIFTEDIIGPADPYPAFIGLVHVRTKDPVIRREVLLEPGQRWSAADAQETARNLRRLFLFSVVRVLPLESAVPGEVDVLVAVKDLWSLRINLNFSLVGSLLQYFRTRPAERNLLGYGKELSLDLFLRLDTLRLGQGFTDPRFLGTQLELSETAAIILNRDTGRPEGSAGSLSVGKPLRTLTTPWGFTVNGSWSTRTARIFRGAQILEVTPTGSDAAIPYVYEAQELLGQAAYTRSFGTRHKLNLTGALVGVSRRFTPPSTVSAELRDAYTREFLPLSENATYLLSSVSYFEARYAVMQNLDSFALSEDVRLGPTALALVRWAEPTFANTVRYRELELSGRYRELFADNLISLRAKGTIRFRPGASPTDRRVALELANAFPSFFLGRFHHRALLDLNTDDLGTRLQLLGGGNGLRGIAPEALSGRSVLLFNTELRSKPIALKTLHLGFALFWDAGAAFDESPKLIHTVGAGLRLLFPQFDIEPLRIDFGWAINGERPDVLRRFSSSFGQITRTQTEFLD